MSKTLPSRPSLDWLRKTAKQALAELRRKDPAARLADAQLETARDYGFTSWRALKKHVDPLLATPADPNGLDETTVAAFLRAVGNGETATVRAALAATPRLVDAVGPHPFWGGRVQMLHVALDTDRCDMFDLALAHGADIDGDNREYTGWSPLMLAAYKQRAGMQRVLVERGARIGLYEALLLGDDARAERLLRPGASAIPPERAGLESLLHLARTPWAIDRLLELGEPRDSRDYWNESPVGAMAKLGGVQAAELVRHLRKRGFEVSAEEFARLGDLASLESLYATDPSFVRRDEVLMSTNDAQVAAWLLERGANPNARTSFGSQGMALHGAAWNGNLELAKVLVAAGADVHGLDVEHRNTPSGYARVARRITNNPACDAVAEYLEKLEGDARG
jgi:ankyrin repeat protein